MENRRASESRILERELGRLSTPAVIPTAPSIPSPVDQKPIGNGLDIPPASVAGTPVEGEKKKIGRPKKGQEKNLKPKKPRTPKVPKEPKTTRTKNKRKSTDSSASGGPDPKTSSPGPSTVAGMGQLAPRWAPPPQNLRYMCEWNGCGRY